MLVSAETVKAVCEKETNGMLELKYRHADPEPEEVPSHAVDPDDDRATVIDVGDDPEAGDDDEVDAGGADPDVPGLRPGQQ
jgi:hypothetical protein